MRTKVAVVSALDRVLDALAEELLAASDEEILAAARELGMDPTMRGSAAFLGLKYTFPRDLRDALEGFDLSGLWQRFATRIEGPQPPADKAKVPRRRKKPREQ